MTELQDPEGVRWPAGEIVGYINDGRRVIVSKSPSATADEQEITLVEGVSQTVGPGVRAVLEILRNTDARRTAIYQTTRGAMDASAPGWAGMRPHPLIRHYMKDARVSRAFDVYPPAQAGVKVWAMLSMEPVDTPIPSSADGSDLSAGIGLHVEYREALYQFALYRAFSKDAEYGGNANLAAAHFNLFTDALGINTGHPNAGVDLSN